ncbi:MAG: transcriptional regulator [Actinomycetota bacterium]|nr:transcriptional regulator [Actinomycetota bacterium]
MRSEEFFDTHPVFTFDEYRTARAESGATLSTVKNLLARHVVSGRVVRVRQALYASVPRGVPASDFAPDPYLLATCLAQDAVVCGHAALQFFGKTYSVWDRYHYFTGDRRRSLSFRGAEFVPVQDPAPLRGLADRGGGIAEHAHAGGTVRVTTLERALADVLHSPERAGDWEEVWRSLEMVEYFDLDEVIVYVIHLGSAITAARVGLFLDRHSSELLVEAHHLEALRGLSPRQPRYLDASREPGRLVSSWNLIVPEHLTERHWEERG